MNCKVLTYNYKTKEIEWIEGIITSIRAGDIDENFTRIDVTANGINYIGCHPSCVRKIVYTKNGWTIEIIDNNNLLNNNIIKQIEYINKPIFFSEITSKYWIFDFEIDGIWFEAKEINIDNNKIILNAYK